MTTVPGRVIRGCHQRGCTEPAKYVCRGTDWGGNFTRPACERCKDNMVDTANDAPHFRIEVEEVGPA